MLDFGASPLHPANTSIGKGLLILNIPIDLISVSLHSFFKNLPAWCEKYGKFCAMLGEDIEFWHKHVSTRWNTIKEPSKKLLKNFDVIGILEELPKIDKKCKAGAVYKNLENFFQPEKRESNLAKLSYLNELCKINERFIIKYQTESPSMPFLLKDSKKLIKEIVDTVAYPNKLLDNLQVDFEDYCNANLKINFTFGAQDANLDNLSAKTISDLRMPVIKIVSKEFDI